MLRQVLIPWHYLVRKATETTEITTTAKTKKTETNKHEKQATVVLSNEAVYNFVITLNNSPQISSTKVMERNLKVSTFSFIYIYLHSTEFLLICYQFNDVTPMVYRPETRRSRHIADKAISRKLGFMS